MRGVISRNDNSSGPCSPLLFDVESVIRQLTCVRDSGRGFLHVCFDDILSKTLIGAADLFSHWIRPDKKAAFRDGIKKSFGDKRR